MKVYEILRDIVFFFLLLAILWVGIYIAKMTDVIDTNLIYVNRKIPPVEKVVFDNNEIEKDALDEAVLQDGAELTGELPKAPSKSIVFPVWSEDSDDDQIFEI